MTPFKPAFVFTALFLVCGSASAQIITETYNFPVGGPLGVISDDATPMSFNQTISGSAIGYLTEVQASLHLQGTTANGGWAGDMYVSLNRGGAQTSILLNQVGTDGNNPAGFGFDGWNVSFRDSAANGDIHLGAPTSPDTVLTGQWQPDGRLNNLLPLRSAMLDVFYSKDPNTDWHLTLSDLNPTGQMTLASWSLTFTGVTAVPEPSTWAAITASALCVFAAFRARARR